MLVFGVGGTIVLGGVALGLLAVAYAGLFVFVLARGCVQAVGRWLGLGRGAADRER